MNDNDGKSNYSAIVAVRFDQKVDGSIVVAPNPVQNDIQIRLTGIEKGIYRMQLQNAAGQTLLTRAITVSQFTQTEIIPRSPILSTGIYWLTIYDNTYKKLSSIRVVLGH